MKINTIKCIKPFIYCCGAILLVAAFSRFIISFRGEQILTLTDPVLGIELRAAVLLVGITELASAFFCLLGQQIILQLTLLLVLGINYTVCLIGRFWVQGQLQGTCLGSLTDPLQLSNGLFGAIAQAAPWFLVLGSFVAIVSYNENEKLEIIRNTPQMSCPSCGGHIQFSTENIGQMMPCPHCNTNIKLRKSMNLKMTCFFCKGRIEFPAHGIGNKLRCPHCQNDITLKEST